MLGGYPGCDSTIRGYRVKFLPLPTDRKPKAIAVYFHGDTAKDWENNGFRDLARWSYEHDVLFLAARSEAWASNPGEEPWRVWYQTDRQGSRVVSSIIDDFVGAYRPTTQRKLYTGVSGGAIYLTSNYMAYAMDRHPGVAVANCGAGNTSLIPAFDWAKDKPALRASVPIHYIYGSLDFLARQIENSYTHFQTEGFNVTREVINGAGHCAFDYDTKTADVWKLYL